MKSEWYVRTPEGKIVGPISERQCTTFLDRQKTLKNYLVRQNESEWRVAEEVHALFRELHKNGIFIRQSGNIYGPFTNERLRILIEKGLKDVELRRGQAQEWLTLEKFLNDGKTNESTQSSDSNGDNSSITSNYKSPSSHGILVTGRYTCKQCNNIILLINNSVQRRCPLCTSEFTEISPELISDQIPERIITFSVSELEARNTFLEWLAEGKYTPQNILTKLNIKTFSPVLVPTWIFDASYRGDWNASCGYYKNVRSLEHVGSGQNQRLATVTRTEVDWRPANGIFSGNCSVMSISTNGEGLVDEIENLIEQTKTFKQDSAIANISLGHLRNLTAIPFDANHESILQSKAMPTIKKDMALKVKSTLPGDTHKDVTYAASSLYVKKTSVYVPAWIIFYLYNNNLFYLIVNGYEPQTVLGKKPIDNNLKNEIKRLYKPVRSGCLNLFIFALAVIVFLVFWVSIFPASTATEGEKDPKIIIPQIVIAISFLSCLLWTVFIIYLSINAEIKKRKRLRNSRIKRMNDLAKILGDGFKVDCKNNRFSHEDSTDTETESDANSLKYMKYVFSLASVYWLIYTEVFGISNDYRKIR